MSNKERNAAEGHKKDNAFLRLHKYEPNQRLPNAQEPEPDAFAIDIPKLVNANNQFALKFYSQIAQNNDENILFSSWSIFTAFSLAYEGARSDTAQEIRVMFEFPNDDNLRRSLFKDVQNDLNVKDTNYSLNTANALWIKEDYEIKEDYIDTAKMYYDSQVENVDFFSDKGISIINEWVKIKTNNKIEAILEKDSTDDLTRIVITNAIYFNGYWLYPFLAEWTEVKDFHIRQGKTVNVSMMYQTRILNYTQNELLEVLELPYKGEKISMLILLPKEIEGLKDVEKILNVDNLSYWRKSLSKTNLDVILPKFKAETKYHLKDNLQKMGMEIPFDKFKADFSGINETEQLYIDQAVHKAFVNVSELGTEAAAATVTGIVGRIVRPVTFRADHPFIFIIQDIQTGNILFIGKVVNPAQ